MFGFALCLPAMQALVTAKKASVSTLTISGGQVRVSRRGRKHVDIDLITSFAERTAGIVAIQRSGVEIVLPGVPRGDYVVARLNQLLRTPPALGQAMYRVAALREALVEEAEEDDEMSSSSARRRRDPNRRAG